MSIIDVRGSAQPMKSDDGRLVVTFNGEIFNYRSLQSRLGYPFRTRGDTEVILAAHRLMGAHEAVEILRGQFAYGLYDADADSLLLARDRLGVLPLYYYVDDDLVAFASEIKALLPMLPGGPELDLQSLHDYLGARSVRAPFTLFKKIYKLLPGHTLTFHRDGTSTLRQYWQLPEEDDRPWTDDHAVAEVRSALTDAVAAALVADVPVGAYLSGGLDSSLIVALTRQLRGGAEIKTFSAAFVDSPDNELPFARQVSEIFGTRHREVMVRPEDFVSDWHRLTWHRDAPMSEASDFAVHRLAQAAREEVTVVLSGEGSDELFAGYPKHRAAPWIERGCVVPAAFRQPVADAIERRLPPAAARARIAVRALGGATPEERIATWFAPFTGRERSELFGGSVTRRSPRSPSHGDIVRRMLVSDVSTWLPDNLLERGDRMSMTASLELRPPFLDHRLVELAFRLPTSLKVRRGVGKWIIRALAREQLPATIVDRRKVGFSVPLDRWLRGDLGDFAGDMLLSDSSLVSSLASRPAVARLVDDHRRGRRNEAARLWPLLCLEVWHEVFLKKSTVGSAV